MHKAPQPDATSQTAVHVTRHASQRLKLRVGLPGSAQRRMADRALVRGLSRAAFTGGPRRYLNNVFRSQQTASNIRVYGEHVYLFDDRKLITVIHIPRHLLRSIREQCRADRRTP